MTNHIDDIVKGLTKAQRWFPGYEGRYYCDESGAVYSALRSFERYNRGRLQVVRVPAKRIILFPNRNGYPIVRLWINNKARTYEVHRLVCRAFHGEPSPGQEACHKNGIRMDCRETNLEWKSRKENHADKRGHGTHLCGERAPRAKLTMGQVQEICRRSRSGERMQCIADEFGISERAVRKIREGESWANETISIRAVQTALRQESRDALREDRG